MPGCHSVMQDALDIGLCSSRWLCARIFFRRSSRGRKFIKPRCSSSGQIALPLKQAAHMASPSITAAAGTSMPARRRCAAQKYFSITHLLRGAGRERIGSYQKTIIRSGPTFAGVAFDCACHQDKRAFASLVPAIIPSCQKSTTGASKTAGQVGAAWSAAGRESKAAIRETTGRNLKPGTPSPELVKQALGQSVYWLLRLKDSKRCPRDRSVFIKTAVFLKTVPTEESVWFFRVSPRLL